MNYPTTRLRYAAEFNPSPPSGVRQSASEFPLYPMEAIHEFGAPSEPTFRPVNDLLVGYSYLEPTDVAYAKVTPCFENGKGLVGGDLDGPAFATTELTVLRPRPGVSRSYLAWVLQSDSFRSPAVSSMTGAGGLRRVAEPFVRDLRVSMPKIARQTAVANYLDHETAEIDALIKEFESALELARERRDSATEGLILASTPTLTAIRRCAPQKSTGTSVNGAPWPALPGEPGVLKTGAASSRTFRPEQNKAVVDEVEVGRLTGPVESDRVLINRANTPSHVGAAAYVREGTPGLYLSDKLWSLKFVGVNEYFAIALRTKLYQDQASQRAVGTSLSMQNLPYEEFLNIRIPVPTSEQQWEICATVASIEDTLSGSQVEITRAIALAKERRAALITAAVTGQIDVTAKHRPAAEQLEDDIKELS